MLRGLAGWLLLLGVIYIPWHDGGVAPLATALLSGLVFLAAMLWLLGHAVGGTQPRIPGACIACVGFLLVQGWWMAINTLRRYDPVTHAFFPAEALWPAAPGTWDGPSSQVAALAFSSMLLSVCIACDLCHYPKWRKRFAYGLALNGALIAVVGILKAAGADPLIPALGVRQGTSFASFEYHGNAGTFLNLCLPPAFGLFIHMRRRTHRLSWRFLAALPFVVIAAGAIVNVSRASQAITVLLTIGLVGWAFWNDHGGADKGERRRWTWQWALPVVAISLMVVGAIASTRGRWAHLPDQLHSKNDRLVMWQVCSYWLGDAGPLGYGPGTYKAIYPTTPQSVMHDLYSRWIVSPYVPGEPVNVWQYVYNDYLQLAFEWGWLGAAVWMILLLGGLVCAMRMILRRSPVVADQVYAAAAAFALLGLCLHSLVDYPLQVISLQFYAALLMGLSWSSRNWRSEPAPKSTFSRLNVDIEAARCN